MSDTNDQPFTCAACGKRGKKIYSYYGSGNGKKLCSKACRDSYIAYKREEAQARARKRIAQTQQSKLAQPQRKPTSRSGFRMLGIKIW